MNIVNPVHIFQHILSTTFNEASMPFQPVKKSANQMHLLTASIDMEHAAQQLLKHKKHTQSKQLVKALASPTHTTQHNYTLTS